MVEINYQEDQTYNMAVGTTVVEDHVCAPQLEAAMSVALGLPTEQVNVTVTTVSQEDVALHFGVYERMLSDRTVLAMHQPGNNLTLPILTANESMWFSAYVFGLGVLRLCATCRSGLRKTWRRKRGSETIVACL